MVYTIYLFFLLWPLLGAGAQEPALFSFVQITDTHLHDEAWIQGQRDQGVQDGGYRNPLTTPGRFREAVEWINTQSNLVFAIFTGDMVEESTPVRYAAFTQCVRDLRIPWILVPGNHDYKLDERLPADKSHGGVDFSFSCAGLHFVGFQTFNPPGYMSQLISKDAMEKVAYFLNRHRNAPVVFIEHAPLRNRKGETDGWEVPHNTLQMYDIIRKCGNVVAVLCGHDHPGFRALTMASSTPACRRSARGPGRPSVFLHGVDRPSGPAGRSDGLCQRHRPCRQRRCAHT